MRYLIPLALCAVFAAAHGDTIVATKQAKLACVKQQVHHLDLKVERLDERYNASVIRTHSLSRHIVRTTHALHLAAAGLRSNQALLADLLVATRCWPARMTSPPHSTAMKRAIGSTVPWPASWLRSQTPLRRAGAPPRATDGAT